MWEEQMKRGKVSKEFTYQRENEKKKWKRKMKKGKNEGRRQGEENIKGKSSMELENFKTFLSQYCRMDI